MTSSLLGKIASLHALIRIKWKMVSCLSFSEQNGFGTNNTRHVQRLFRQYTNYRVLKY